VKEEERFNDPRPTGERLELATASLLVPACGKRSEWPTGAKLRNAKDAKKKERVLNLRIMFRRGEPVCSPDIILLVIV
jgi:hypothetical protein